MEIYRDFVQVANAVPSLILAAYAGADADAVRGVCRHVLYVRAIRTNPGLGFRGGGALLCRDAYGVCH
ncbi:hypothetical protein D3C85_1878000 [compost metagenome]